MAAAWLARRRLLAAYPWLRGLGPPLALFALSLLLRLPFVSNALVNWDAVQFALATRSFDIARHQPHPPGYILYIGWGRLLTWLTGDANAAFVLTSLIAGSLAVALLYVLGREMIGARSALLAATLFALSPLVWYYSIVALTYAVESLFLLVVAWLCWRALAACPASEGRKSWRERLALLAALMLGIAGGVRQSTLVLLLPLWLYAAWKSGRRAFWRGWAVLAADLPRLARPAGLARRRPPRVPEGRPLAARLRRQQDLRALWRAERRAQQPGPGRRRPAGWPEPRRGAVRAGVRASGARCGGRLSRRHWAVLALWAGPALAVFVLGHIGQVGYLLLILPAACLVLALYVEAAGQGIAPVLGSAPAVRRRWWPASWRRPTSPR